MPQLGELIDEFPEIIDPILSSITNLEELRTSKLLGGGQLKKVPQKDTVDQFVWENLGGRPRDLLTLFRHVLSYKLTRRANMFVRQFLAKNEHSILLVIDSS